MPLVALPLAITLAVAPAQLRQESPPPSATVTVSAPGATRLRLWCSAGTLSAPAALGRGRFAATYRPPAAGRPTYAVLAAWDEATGEAAAVTVPLGARIEIPVETDAGAEVVAVIHGRRSTARANPAGHARLFAWVWPGERTATVTALDAAGNAASSEVPIDVRPPDGVFLLAPPALAPGAPVRIYAFATGGATPRLQAPGASLAVTARRGVASAELRAGGDVTVTAAANGAAVTQQLHVAAATPPPARSIALTPAVRRPSAAARSPAAAAGRTGSPSSRGPGSALARAAAPPPLSPWELGAAAGARYAGALVGIGGAVEARRRLGRFALGLDLGGHYAAGALDGDEAAVGGFAARLVGELRLAVAPRAALFVAAGLGAHVDRLRRTPPVGRAATATRGGPTLAAQAGVLGRLGPGLLEIGVGYAWSPLVGAGLANVDGAVLTVGYRAARWRRRRRRRAARRRGARRRCAGRRRPGAPG